MSTLNPGREKKRIQTLLKKIYDALQWYRKRQPQFTTGEQIDFLQTYIEILKGTSQYEKDLSRYSR